MNHVLLVGVRVEGQPPPQYLANFATLFLAASLRQIFASSRPYFSRLLVIGLIWQLVWENCIPLASPRTNFSRLVWTILGHLLETNFASCL